MKGWKTWAGAVIVAVSAGLEALGGEYSQYAKILVMVGGALGIVGIGHKVEKAKKEWP